MQAAGVDSKTSLGWQMQAAGVDSKSSFSKPWKEVKQGPTIFQLALIFSTILTCIIFFLVQQSGVSLIVQRDSLSSSQISPPTNPPPLEEAGPTTTANILFGIGAASHALERRKEYIRSWWRPGETRGFVYVDRPISNWSDPTLPELRVSEDTSGFNYTFPNGRRSAIRISRIVSEMFRLRLENVRWFVLGDDDTVFFVDNLVQVLDKYDHTQLYYIGSSSENHIQNVRGFSSNMAYGGGGFAISYSLAEALSAMQDDCLQRYHFLYGSDDRIQACMAELGVQLTKEPGFHQLDVLGDVWGLLAAHPLAPLISLHHLNVIQPLFPGLTQQQSLHQLMKAAAVDPAGVIQQSICYEKRVNITIQVSWGYLVQVSSGLIPPRLLELPLRTFAGWYGEKSELSLPFKTRALPVDYCERPMRFYLAGANKTEEQRSNSSYARIADGCQARQDAIKNLEWIFVEKEATDSTWFRAPRRQCCRILSAEQHEFHLRLGKCKKKEFAAGK